jgi:hypothetical protein
MLIFGLALAATTPEPSPDLATLDAQLAEADVEMDAIKDWGEWERDQAVHIAKAYFALWADCIKRQK